jgi:YHS domain-containing protein
MKLFLPLVAVAAMALASCTKIETPAGTPVCIKKKIRQLQKEETENPASVWRYTYNGQTVYYFTAAGCCDKGSSLYDDDCNYICMPDGGFSGGGDGQCTDFFANRSDDELIWKNDR